MKANILNKVFGVCSKSMLICLFTLFSASYAVAAEEGKLSFAKQGIELEADNTLSLVLDNGNTRVSSMDFVFLLPAGVKIADESNLYACFQTLDSRIPDGYVSEIMAWDATQAETAAGYKAYKVMILPDYYASVREFKSAADNKIALLKVNVAKNFDNNQDVNKYVRFRDVHISGFDADGNRALVFKGQESADYRLTVMAGALSYTATPKYVYDEAESLLPVNFDSKIALGAMQFDVTMPKGVKINGISANRARLNGMSVGPKKIDALCTETEDVYRVVIHSLSGRTIPAGNSELLTIKLQGAADYNVSVDANNVSITNVVLSNPSGVSDYMTKDVPSFEVVDGTSIMEPYYANGQLVDISWDAVNYIDEDNAKFDADSKQLVADYKALMVNTPDYDLNAAMVPVNAKVQSLRDDIKKFEAVRYFVVTNPSAGKPSVIDAQLAMDYYLNIETLPSGLDLKRLVKKADVDGNGVINNIDAQLIADEALK